MRVIRILVAAAFAMLATAVAALAGASAAGADATDCSPVRGYCVDLASGQASASAIPQTDPVPLTVTSSQAAAVRGAGTDIESEIGLLMEDSSAADGSLAVAASEPGVGQLIGAGFMGYQAGSLGAQFLCSTGVGALCIPPKSGTYTPNADIHLGGDPGWVGGDQTIQTTGPPVSISFKVPPTAGLTWGGGYAAQISPASDSFIGSAQIAFYIHDGDGSPNACSGSDLFGRHGGDYQPCGFTDTDHVPELFVWCKPDVSACTSATPIGDSIQYRSLGNPKRPDNAGNPNPARTLRTTDTCSPLDGSPDLTEVATSGSFTELDAGVPTFPVPAACPPGTQLTATRVVELTSGLPDKDIWTWPAFLPLLTSRAVLTP